MESKADDSCDEFQVVGGVPTPKAQPIPIVAPSLATSRAAKKASLNGSFFDTLRKPTYTALTSNKLEDGIPAMPKLVRTDSIQHQSSAQQMGRALAPKPFAPAAASAPRLAARVGAPTPSKGLSTSSAFGGAGQPLPCNLTVSGTVNTPNLKVDEIFNTVGDLIMDFRTPDYVSLATNSLININGIQCTNGIIVNENGSNLDVYQNISGVCTITTATGNAFVSGTDISYQLTQIGNVVHLTISAFTGTTDTSPPGSVASQQITFNPSIDEYVTEDISVPVMVETSVAANAFGSFYFESGSVPTTAVVACNDQVPAWQWVSNTTGQGWYSINLTWHR